MPEPIPVAILPEKCVGELPRRPRRSTQHTVRRLLMTQSHFDRRATTTTANRNCSKRYLVKLGGMRTIETRRRGRPTRWTK